MATQANFASISLKGKPNTNLIASGLKVSQIVDSNVINGVDFVFDATALGVEFDAATDKIYLVSETRIYSKLLSRVGDCHRWTISPTDFGSASTPPGSTFTMDVRLVLERTVSTVPSRVTSEKFSLTVERSYGFAPGSISGLVCDLNAYDLSEANAAAISNWDDASPYDADVIQATSGNQPTKQTTVDGFPYVKFDGTDDSLATTVATFNDPLTAFFVGRIRSATSTDRNILSFGTSTALQMMYDDTSLIAAVGATTASTPTPALDTWFVGVLRRDGSNNIGIQLNMVSEVTAGSAGATGTGIMTIGGTSSAIDVARVLVYNSSLGSTDIARVVRSLAAQYGISL